MRLNRKQKLFIYSLFFLILGIGIYLYSNKPRNLNIILITIDSLRPDHLGCYGYVRNTSPNIDKLAKEGVLFTQVFTPTPWTGALVSLLTSTYPSTHRVDNFGVVLDQRLLTFAEILKKNNYSTICIGREDLLYKNFPGLTRGFTHFLNQSEINKIIEDVKAWIIKNQSKKFFLWAHFYDYPHAPYKPPFPFNQIFRINNKFKNIPIGKGEEFFGVIPEWVAINNITDIEYYISQYDGEIAFVDSIIGEILNTLSDTGLDKKTIIIITADHGESLGERNIYFQHGDSLYNEQIKVPLIIKGALIPQGKIVDFPVGLIDICPSILDILNIKVDRNNFEGISFLPLILDKKKKHENNFVFSEADVTKVIDNSVVNAEQKAIINEQWKLIYERSEFGIRYELYGFKNDPQELINLVNIEKEQFEFLKAKLEEWMNRPKPDMTPSTKPLDEETKEKLRGLGYLQ